ncbi:MAG: tripartite tricarboxylate transporter permease [Peptococcaceae bacterium]
MIEGLLIGMHNVFDWASLAAIALGVLWGIIGGMIPGINATIAMALLLPFTWGLEPVNAILLLVGVYCGGEYGGSIPAILIGTPGTTAAAATTIDGYELHKQGKSGLALGTSLISSSFGGFLSAVVLIFVAIPLASVALKFGPSEYFALAIAGLTLICSLGGRNVFKGLLAGAIGIFVATIGYDPMNGIPRYTFGSLHLADGFEMIALMMGLFAVSELLSQAQELTDDSEFNILGKVDTRLPGWNTIKKFLPISFVSAVMGVVIGAMPGVGASTACWVAYSETKRWAKDSDTFGKGNIKGVAAPEAANNAVTGGALVPLLALGIPGSNSTAIMLGALMIHNVQPGPLLFTKQPEIPYSIFISLLVANVFMLILGYFIVKLAIKVTKISKPVLFASIMTLVFTGSYAYSGESFSILVTIGFGLLGYLMKKFAIPYTATVLGFVLGFIMEANLRRALLISKGDWSDALFNSGISTILIILAILAFVGSTYQNLKKPVDIETNVKA